MCFLSQYNNAMYVLDADSSNPSVSVVFFLGSHFVGIALTKRVKRDVDTDSFVRILLGSDRTSTCTVSDRRVGVLKLRVERLVSWMEATRRQEEKGMARSFWAYAIRMLL